MAAQFLTANFRGNRPPLSPPLLTGLRKLTLLWQAIIIYEIDCWLATSCHSKYAYRGPLYLSGTQTGNTRLDYGGGRRIYNCRFLRNCEDFQSLFKTINEILRQHK